MPIGCDNEGRLAFDQQFVTVEEKKETHLEQIFVHGADWRNGLDLKVPPSPSFPLPAVLFPCWFSRQGSCRVKKKKKKCPYLFPTSGCCWGRQRNVRWRDDKQIVEPWLQNPDKFLSYEVKHMGCDTINTQTGSPHSPQSEMCIRSFMQMQIKR